MSTPPPTTEESSMESAGGARSIAIGQKQPNAQHTASENAAATVPAPMDVDSAAVKIWAQLVYSDGRDVDSCKSAFPVKMLPDEDISDFLLKLPLNPFSQNALKDVQLGNVGVYKARPDFDARTRDAKQKPPSEQLLKRDSRVLVDGVKVLGPDGDHPLWVVLPATISRKEGTYEELYQFVEQYLENYEATFLAFKGHPFDTVTLNGNEIPLINDFPSILWHRLDIDDEWTDWKKFSKSREYILYGVSGAGKTRMMFEWLAREWGFYFVGQRAANTGGVEMGEIGSVDLQSAALQIAAEVDKLSVGDIGYTLKQRFLIAERELGLLFMCRYCIMEHVRTKFGYSPLNWLYLQVLGLPKKDIYFDLAAHVYSAVKQKYSTAAKPRMGIMPMVVVIDEAQGAVETLVNIFPKVSDFVQGNTAAMKDERSILSVAVHTFSQQDCRVVITGTSLRIQSVAEEIALSYVKATEQAEMTDVNLCLKNFDEFDAFSKFVTMYFPSNNLAEQDLRFAHAYLRGRARFTAAFVSQLLTYQRKYDKLVDSHSFRMILENVIADIVTFHREKKNLFSAIRDLHSRLKKQSAHSTLSDFETLVNAFYRHKELSEYVSTADSENWIECGIGRIKSTDEGEIIYCNEPLVFLAGYQHFDSLNSLLRNINVISNYSAQGFVFEDICCELLKRNWFANGNTLRSLFSLFSDADQAALSKLPNWLLDGKITLHPSKFLISLQQHRSGGIKAFIEDCFLNCNTSAFFCPVNSERIDRFAVLKLANDKFVSVSMQMKFLTEDLSESLFSKARQTVLANRLFNKMGIPFDLYRRFSVHIGIVIVYGARAHTKNRQIELQCSQSRGKQFIYLVIDARNKSFFSTDLPGLSDTGTSSKTALQTIMGRLRALTVGAITTESNVMKALTAAKKHAKRFSLTSKQQMDEYFGSVEDLPEDPIADETIFATSQTETVPSKRQ